MSRAVLAPAHERVIGWIQTLPGPAAAAYEAGPTGFGLAPAGGEHRVCGGSAVEDPPTGRGPREERPDALLLARLLRLGELLPVRVPTVAEETARDLVRAREACAET